MQIEYQYPGEEKQIIQGQNLTYTIVTEEPPFYGGQCEVGYTFNVRWRPEINAQWRSSWVELHNNSLLGAITDIYLYLDSNINISADKQGFPSVEGTARGGTFHLHAEAYNPNTGAREYGSTPFGYTGIYDVGRAEFLGLERIDGQPDNCGNLPTDTTFTIYSNGNPIYSETRSEIPTVSVSLLDYLNFAEERLELGIDYGAVGGMRFNTTQIETSDGSQQRNANWWLPLGRWQLGERTLLESQKDKLEEVTYLKEFHAARKGSLEGFRFKDWSDYQIIAQIVGIGDGVETEWQLKKTYYAGSASCARPITKPVEGTVKLKIDEVEQLEGWALDHGSGLIRFDSPPPTGAVIKVDCEFDVPVWFESDSLGWRLEGYQEGEAIYRLENVLVEEGRIPIPKDLEIQPLPNAITEVLDLGIIYDTVETIEYQTSKQKLPSGYVRRDDNYNVPITKINLGERVFNREELDNLLGFFWCAKGKAIKFRLKTINGNRGVYFNNDQLNLKFEALSNSENLYTVNSLSFQDSFYDFPPTFLDNTGFKNWSGISHINNSSSWIPNNSNSKWISYIEDTNNIIYSEDYIYEITYEFLAERPLKRIKGRVSVDNELLSIKLNGEIKLENVHQNFATWNDFYLYDIKEGANSVTFTVQNNDSPDTSNPTGIRVEWLFASI